MKTGNKRLLLLVTLLVIVVAVFIFVPSEPVAQVAQAEQEQEAKPTVESTTLVNVDDDAPLFTVEMLSGESISLESLRGKVVLINFWATWCPPCRKELAVVQSALIDRFEGRDFAFLPISRGEQSEVVAKFMSENGYTFDVGLDSEELIYKSYASNYIPRNFLVNRHGVVVKTSVGYDSEEFAELVQTIEMTLNAR